VRVARSFRLRCRDTNRSFRNPRCLPSVGDSHLLWPITGPGCEPSSVSRLCTSRYRLSASFRPRHPSHRLRRCEASSGERRDVQCTCALARIFIRGLGLRSRVFPCDVGKAFERPLPPTDFCRPVSTYGHTHRAPSSSPASERVSSSRSFVSPAFAHVHLPLARETSHPQRARETLPSVYTDSGVP